MTWTHPIPIECLVEDDGRHPAVLADLVGRHHHHQLPRLRVVRLETHARAVRVHRRDVEYRGAWIKSRHTAALVYDSMSLYLSEIVTNWKNMTVKA